MMGLEFEPLTALGSWPWGNRTTWTERAPRKGGHGSRSFGGSFLWLNAGVFGWCESFKLDHTFVVTGQSECFWQAVLGYCIAGCMIEYIAIFRHQFERIITA